MKTNETCSLLCNQIRHEPLKRGLVTENKPSRVDSDGLVGGRGIGRWAHPTENNERASCGSATVNVAGVGMGERRRLHS